MSRLVVLLPLCGFAIFAEAKELSAVSQKAIAGCELAGQFYQTSGEERQLFTSTLSERDGSLMISCGTNLKAVFTTLYAYPSPKLKVDNICLPPEISDISLAQFVPMVVERIKIASVGQPDSSASDVAILTTSAVLDVLPVAFPCQ